MQPPKEPIYQLLPVRDVSNYQIQKSFEATEISYLFKKVFGHLIDPNIITIHIDVKHFSVLKTAVASQDLFDFCEYIELQFPLHFFDKDIPLLHRELSESLDLFAEPKELDLLQIGMSPLQGILKEAHLGHRMPDRIIQCVIDLINQLDVKDFREMELFGTNELAYDMAEAYLQRFELEEQLDEIREKHEESVKYLVGLAKELSEKPASTIQNRLMSQLEKNFKSSSAIGDFDSDAATRWDEVGYCTQEGVFSDVVFDDIKKTLYRMYQNLSRASQLAIQMNLIDEDGLGFDYDEAIDDVTDQIDLDEYFEKLTKKIVAHASGEWADKVWDE